MQDNPSLYAKESGMLLEYEYTTKMIPKRAITNPYSITVQAIDTIDHEQICQVQVILVINQQFEDNHIFQINTIP